VLKSRLIWRCRRGMLELDLLLQDFLHQKYDQLPLPEQQTFEDLLTRSDQQLLDWLMGKSVPEETALAELVGKIRH